MNTPKPTPVSGLLGIAWKLMVLGAILFAAHYSGDWVLSRLTTDLTPSTEPRLHRTIMIAMSVYVLLMTLPFVPGAEIGLGMLMMFGARIAPLVYASTVLTLSISFLVGRLLPENVIIDLLRKARMRRASDLLRSLQPMSKDARLAFLLKGAPGKILPLLLRYRFLVLIAALNLPGNAVIGGGGGICIVAGFCRLFSFPGFVIAVAFAAAPIPLIIFLSG